MLCRYNEQVQLMCFIMNIIGATGGRIITGAMAHWGAVAPMEPPLDSTR